MFLSEGRASRLALWLDSFKPSSAASWQPGCGQALCPPEGAVRQGRAGQPSIRALVKRRAARGWLPELLTPGGLACDSESVPPSPSLQTPGVLMIRKEDYCRSCLNKSSSNPISLPAASPPGSLIPKR